MTSTVTEAPESTEAPTFDPAILAEGMRGMYEQSYLPLITKIETDANALREQGKGRADKLSAWKTDSEESADLRTRVERAKATYDKAVAALNDAAEAAIPGKSETYEKDEATLKDSISTAKALYNALTVMLSDEEKAALPKVPTIGRASSGGSSTAHSTGDPEKVRVWARSQGIPVKDRGRLSSELVKQYETATSQNGENAS